MSYGEITARMVKILRPLVAGKVVVDFGAGDCSKAATIKALGASRVLAVDKAPMPPTDGIEQVVGYFAELGDEVPPEYDVAFVSWPQNYYQPNGLALLAERAKVIVYLGSNTDGNACGYRDLFLHMLTRTLEAHVPHRRNTLIAVGEFTGRMRKPTWEEKAALSDKLLNFRA